MMKSHQLEQTAERGPQRPCVGMLNVQQETLQEERLWELCCRNLHADQLPQHQVLWGLMKCCCLMMTTVALGERHHSTCGSSKKKMLQVRRLHHLDRNTVYCALGRGGGSDGDNESESDSQSHNDGDSKCQSESHAEDNGNVES